VVLAGSCLASPVEMRFVPSTRVMVFLPLLAVRQNLEVNPVGRLILFFDVLITDGVCNLITVLHRLAYNVIPLATWLSRPRCWSFSFIFDLQVAPPEACRLRN
jgi:hypothetical protein